MRSWGTDELRRATTRRKPAASRKPSPPGTREQLVLCARNLLEEGGYGGASVLAIADRAGVSAGALYRHFPSKAELFVEVFRDAAGKDLAALTEAAAATTGAARIESAVATFARRVLRHRRLAWALVYEPVDPLLDAERLVCRREFCRFMAGLLRDAIASGEIPDQDVELTAAATVGAMAEALVGPLSPVAGHVKADEEIISNLMRFCRRSIGATEQSIGVGFD